MCKKESKKERKRVTDKRMKKMIERENLGPKIEERRGGVGEQKEPEKVGVRTDC